MKLCRLPFSEAITFFMKCKFTLPNSVSKLYIFSPSNNTRNRMKVLFFCKMYRKVNVMDIAKAGSFDIKGLHHMWCPNSFAIF